MSTEMIVDIVAGVVLILVTALIPVVRKMVLSNAQSNAYSLILDIAQTVVDQLNQQRVGDLKDHGKFTDDEKRLTKKMAADRIRTQLPDNVKALMGTDRIDEVISSAIESAVMNTKRP